jgi:exodeoxyribonuclease VII large subunit
LAAHLVAGSDAQYHPPVPRDSFFDFRERTEKQKRASRKTAPASTATPAPGDTLTVTQITSLIDHAVQAGLPARVLVRGETSGVKLHQASGHLYLSLKDAGATIDCMVYRRDVARLRVMPENGIEVIATGQVRVYPPRGSYQLYCESLEPVGRGAFELLFRKTLAKLKDDGLLAPERKKPLPPFPMRIALVTSRATAALHDMLKVLRRYPFLQLYLINVPVQGDVAAAELTAAIRLLSKATTLRLDLVLLGRGGGSPDDLWPFNDEALARAIAACPLPIVTGIGHEIDTSIADLVADYHAHTPTEAAQVAVAQWRSAGETIDLHGARMRRSLRHAIESGRQQLSIIEKHETFRHPTRRIDRIRQLLDERQRALAMAASRQVALGRRSVERLDLRWARAHPAQTLALRHHQLINLERRLKLGISANLTARLRETDALSARLLAAGPQAILNRGFSITRRKRDARTLLNAKEINPGERLVTQLASGTIESVADDGRQGRLF